MNDAINSDYAMAMLVKDRIGKPSYKGSPIGLVYDLMQFGVADDALEASVHELRNSSPRPKRLLSYQPYAAAKSCSASAAMTNSAAIPTPHSSLHFLPGES